MKKKKMIIIGTLGIIALTSAIAIPIIVINNNDKKDKTDVEAVVKLLKNKNTQERTIILPVDSIGKIIDNKKLIILKIKELIKNSKYDDVKIDVLVKNNDTTIHYLKKEIIVKLTKGKTTKQLKEIWVQRERNLIEEDIFSIKTILDVKTGNDLIISLPSSSFGNIIGKVINKNAIEKELRKLIDSSNTNGAIDHVSLKGTTIIVSMTTDSPISTSSQNIIVTISKAGGTSSTTSAAFQVKRLKNSAEITGEDIRPIKTILDAKTGNDLIISLPSSSFGNIIGKVINKNAIEKELRKLINPSNADGAIDHVSLIGTTIIVSMTTDSPISTSSQNIIVTISKAGGTSIRTTKTYQVKRNQKVSEINSDIKLVKHYFDLLSEKELIISLPNTAINYIIRNNKDAIEKKLSKLMDRFTSTINFLSLKGVTITVSMTTDSLISTTLQNIIITISKDDGDSLITKRTYQVKRNQKVSEINADINAIKTILDVKIGNDLIISLPSSSFGNIIGKVINKNAIEKELRKLIDSSNTNGAIDHVSLKGVTITISMNADSAISTSSQNIIVTISKTSGASIRTTKTFQVKKL